MTQLTSDTQRLINTFNQLFAEAHNTRLVAGDGEPEYIPAGIAPIKPYHQMIFAHGFFASALHEVAHWCVAGETRRKLRDFGYWYRPDGRTQAQQQAFEQVEVKPQALEWVFSQASQRAFHASTDNLTGASSDDTAFRFAVSAQARAYLEQGLPDRAALFCQALEEVFGGTPSVDKCYWPDERQP